MSDKFNADSFDFEKEYEEKCSSIKKPNILVCGATGVGKSSFINEVFGKHMAQVGEGDTVTRGINKCEDENSSVVLYDSEGYEIGNEKQSYFKNNIIGIIDKMKQENPNDLENHIHEVWYFISAANKRVTQTDISAIEEIQKRNVPIAIVVTQIDNVDEEELNDICKTIKKDLPKILFFTVCVTDDKEIAEAVKPYNQKDNLVQWAMDNLDDVLKIGFASSLNNQLDFVKDTVNSKIVPIYIASSTAAAIVPIPLADAALLTPIQLSMSVHIMAVYGIGKLNGAVTSVVNSVIISQVGKTLAKSLIGSVIKFIPGGGSFVGAAINTTVATTITTALGYAISELCYRYSKAILEGKDVDIELFFNSEALKAAIKMFYNKR